MSSNRVPVVVATLAAPLIAWMVLLLFLDLGSAEAALCSVPSGTHATIQSAVDDPSCDVINLTEDLYEVAQYIAIGRSVTISGQSPTTTVVKGVSSRVFYIYQIGDSPVVTLTDMTVTNGRDYQNGGGIGAFGESEVVLLRVNVTGNWAGKRGGGLYASWRATIIDSEFFGNGCLDFVCDGGAVYGDGRTTVEKSSFISNTAGVGAAIYNGGHLTVANSILLSNTAWGAGGAIARRHTIITNSWLAHNQAPKGGALYGEPGDEVSINGSTLSDNSATEEGGAIWIVDEPNPPGFVRIVNSTLSNNSSDGEGGAIFIESHPFYSFEADVHITNSTLNRNSAAAGGSIHSISTTVEITNSIVANSLDGGNCSGMPLASHGNNIDSDGTCGLDQVGDLSNVNPLLLPLDDNGGQTPTHALFQSSPAVDAAKSEGCPDIDQRGVPRPFDGDGDLDPVCDIGAYELNVALEVRHNYLPLIIQAEP